MSDSQVKLTPQAIFDAVCEHMDKQREPSMCDAGFHSCAYRSADGTKACAVGCLLTDAEVAPIAADDEANVDDVHGLLGRGLLPARLVPHIALLGELQAAHDQTAHDHNSDQSYMAAWKRSMARRAADFSLSTARLDAIEV